VLLSWGNWNGKAEQTINLAPLKPNLVTTIIEIVAMNLKCSKCGSLKIIPLVGMIDQGQASDGTLKALVAYTNPEAWVFKGAVYAKLKAHICGGCGYTELIAEDAAALYDAYQKAKS
jgi:ribosomal protein S27AE